jgi:hypothetical protein
LRIISKPVEPSVITPTVTPSFSNQNFKASAIPPDCHQLLEFSFHKQVHFPMTEVKYVRNNPGDT